MNVISMFVCYLTTHAVTMAITVLCEMLSQQEEHQVNGALENQRKLRKSSHFLLAKYWLSLVGSVHIR
jgi:hypothetical protein